MVSAFGDLLERGVLIRLNCQDDSLAICADTFNFRTMHFTNWQLVVKGKLQRFSDAIINVDTARNN
jgi:hypothetical protein